MIAGLITPFQIYYKLGKIMGNYTATITQIALIDIFVSPGSVFECVTLIKKWSLIALLSLISVILISKVMFYNNMSLDWLVDQQSLYIGGVTISEKEAAIQLLRQSASYTGIINGIFSILTHILIIALLAGYFLLISKFFNTTKKQLNYNDWFNFSIWTQMPLLINLIGFILLFSTSKTPNLPISLSDYASVNQLFLNLEPTHSLYSWSSSMNLFHLWSIIIIFIGLKVCCKFSFFKSSFLATLPYITFFSLWYWFI